MKCSLYLCIKVIDNHILTSSKLRSRKTSCGSFWEFSRENWCAATVTILTNLHPKAACAISHWYVVSWNFYFSNVLDIYKFKLQILNHTELGAEYQFTLQKQEVYAWWNIPKFVILLEYIFHQTWTWGVVNCLILTLFFSTKSCIVFHASFWMVSCCSFIHTLKSWMCRGTTIIFATNLGFGFTTFAFGFGFRSATIFSLPILARFWNLTGISAIHRTIPGFMHILKINVVSIIVDSSTIYQL